MLAFLGTWWSTNKNEVGKCTLIVLGALVWYVGRELMHRQRLPFLSAHAPAQPVDHHSQPIPSKEA